MQAEISDAERAYIAQGVAQGLRNDGRGCRDMRPLELELGVIAQANGSARLRAGGTDVIVAVKVRAECVMPACIYAGAGCYFERSARAQR
jgi:exosome complex component RRP42